MRISSIRIGFCLAVAVIAAAVADPLVESASNAGWFGRGPFTDGSNLDVLPALFIGAGLLALYLVGKAQLILLGKALPGSFAALLPGIFTLQMLTLYVMETAEQLVAWGHILGPAIWLGGPLPATLAIHCAVCLTVTFAIARSLRALAATTLRVIRLIRALATFAARATELVSRRALDDACLSTFAPVLCGIRERAPPTLVS